MEPKTEEKEQKPQAKVGDILEISTEKKPVVMTKDGALICETANEALVLSILLRLEEKLLGN